MISLIHPVGENIETLYRMYHHKDAGIPITTRYGEYLQHYIENTSNVTRRCLQFHTTKQGPAVAGQLFITTERVHFVTLTFITVRMYVLHNKWIEGAIVNRYMSPWASYQIRKFVGCAYTGNTRDVFPARRQRKLLVSDPGMHHHTCFTHVPWCMSG